MAMTAQDYQQSGLHLLPNGKAWTKAPDGSLAQLMLATGDEFARIDNVNDALLNEMHPDRAFMLLESWEDFAGLPDCSIDREATIESRRSALKTKLTMAGSLCIHFMSNWLHRAVTALRWLSAIRTIACGVAITLFTPKKTGFVSLSMWPLRSLTTRRYWTIASSVYGWLMQQTLSVCLNAMPLPKPNSSLYTRINYVRIG